MVNSSSLEAVYPASRMKCLLAVSRTFDLIVPLVSQARQICSRKYPLTEFVGTRHTCQETVSSAASSRQQRPLQRSTTAAAAEAAAAPARQLSASMTSRKAEYNYLRNYEKEGQSHAASPETAVKTLTQNVYHIHRVK